MTHAQRIIRAGNDMADVLAAMDAKGAPSWWDGHWLADLVRAWREAAKP